MMAKKLLYLTDELRDQCLQIYLKACKYKHALAFFQWREMFSPMSDKGILRAVFESRIEYLRNQEARIGRNIEIAE